MSIKKLFEKNKQAISVDKYLKKTNEASPGAGIENEKHFAAAVRKNAKYNPPTNYSEPSNFAKYGSAKRYYENAFDYVTNYYPYDGSQYEQIKFYNDFNPLEAYVFDHEYPFSRGYITLGSPYGSAASSTPTYWSASAEYVQIKGGPHSGTIYSTASNRTNNLEFGGVSGSSVEFFFKKNNLIVTGTQSPRQVVMDIWNGQLSSSADYGRFRIEILSGSEDRFYVTMMSGTNGFNTLAVPTTGGLPLSSGSWRQYSLVFNTSQSAPTIDFYMNGVCHQTGITGSTGQINTVTGPLVGNLGALRASPSGTSYNGLSMEGYGKLSASLDEFRFWKSALTAQDVGRHWFTNVYGGSNKYDANVDLGVYYKFNEGITNTASVDRVMLDYSGRISNGLFVGYNSSMSRNTGSAIDDLNLTSIREKGDPIVRSGNPLLVADRTSLVDKGRQYDYTNTSYMMNTMPSWIYEEDEQGAGELGNLTQIMGSYFDTLSSQIHELTEIKSLRYLSGSTTGTINEFPYNDRLLESLGIETPEIFQNIGTLGQFLQRDEQINFDQQLVDIKNTIYKNIYNNLTPILKAKGNEKAIRNFIRCYGIGDDILSLNTYANNQDFDLITNYSPTTSNKKYVDFSGLINISSSRATVYQHYDSNIPSSRGYISASAPLNPYAFTVEAEIVFPSRANAGLLTPQPIPVVTSSLFGFHTPNATTALSTDATWSPISTDFGLQVYAIKSPSEYAEITSPDFAVKDVYFVVKDRGGNVVLSSSVFQNAYDNQKWNLALSVKNNKHPFAETVTGASLDKYNVQLYGVNYDSGIKRASFTSNKTVTLTSGTNLLHSSKKLYAGAHRINFTGAIQDFADTRISSVRFWNDYLSTGTIDLHARDVDSFGQLNPIREAYSFQQASGSTPSDVSTTFIPQAQTLALNWDFANVTSSDASGKFSVADYSSGSASGSYIGDYQGTTFSEINLRQMTAEGQFFPLSHKQSTIKQFVFTEKKQLPEYADSSDFITVNPYDMEVFTPISRPINFYFSIEKSMYRSISQRMLDMFASLEEFNNLIGEPVNRYRPNYKAMEKLREIFFRKVGNTPDLEKYVKYFKWIDDAMGQLVSQLFPASSRHSDGSRTMIESHVLERPKYHYHYFGNRKLQEPNPGSPPRRIRSVCRSVPGWKFDHAPIPLVESANCNWWRTAAERNNPALGTVPVGVLNTRNHILNAIRTDLTGSQVVCTDADLNSPLRGGINQSLSKIRNVLDVSFSDFKSLENCNDEVIPNQKKKLPFKATKDGLNYKGDLLVPFTAVSSSIVSGSGYRQTLNVQGLTNLEITNLHEDSYYSFGQSVPVQSPFTNVHVGGLQSRHVRPLSVIDRKEQYDLQLEYGRGTFRSIITGSTPKGHYFRGLTAKSPVNIANIGDVTGSSGSTVLGNFQRRYEFVQTSNRAANNIDFIFNNSNYYFPELSGAIPTSFVTPPAMRNANQTGSADFAAPRQIATRRKTQVIFTERFAAPGSKFDSKQQFRDIPSDQFSPNNALPFRNQYVRQLSNSRTSAAGLNYFLARSTQWGGFVEDIRNPYNPIYILSQSAGPNSLNTIYNAGNLPPAATGYYTESHVVVDGFANPYNQRQRNTTYDIRNTSTYYGWQPGTGSLQDNAFVERPIPAADRTSWFMSLAVGGASGLPFSAGGPLPNLGSVYDRWVSSGSQYPPDMSPTTSSLFDPAGAAIATVVPTSALGSKWDARGLRITDTNGTTVEFIGDISISWDAAPVRTAGVPVTWSFGVLNLSSNVTRWGQSFSTAIASAQDNGDIQVTAVDNSAIGLGVTLTQDTLGSAGNTTFTRIGSWTGSPTATGWTGSPADYLDFTGGMTEHIYYFGSSVITGTSGETKFPWAEGIDYVPWSQLRSGQTAYRSYLRSQNFYDLPPTREGLLNDPLGFKEVGTNYVVSDQAGNHINYTYSKRFVEPPITSKYKPLLHQVMALGGSPAVTDKSELISKSVTYTYGNDLQGFANKELNLLISNNRHKKYMSGRIKRPYEVFRDNYNDKLGSDTTGISFFKLMSYSEVIYPREIYTYLSGTRSRLSFINNFWKNDKAVNTTEAATAVVSYTAYTDYTDESRIEKYNRQYPRLLSQPSSYKTSQGYAPERSRQLPFISTPAGGFGSGSMWPLDSYIWSDYAPVTASSGYTQDQIAGGNSTLPSGELLMPHYGSEFHVSSSPLTATVQMPSNGNIVDIGSAQYVYTVPSQVVKFNGSLSTNEVWVTQYSIAGPLSRPPWTAGTQRKFVDGISKGSLTAPQFPFYNTYDDYIQEVKAIGKDFTILPEFRISENLPSYQSAGNIGSIVSASLALTGASPDVYDATSADFVPRYSTTDVIEYLSPFMDDKTTDLSFNKMPRHFELKSSAITKLLPYNGFYPVARSLELATLFSSSYGPHVVATGEHGPAKTAGYNNAFRPLLRPFFAPGILYNSIKSGLAVQYPVVRGDNNLTYFNNRHLTESPLAGGLSGTISPSSLLLTGSIPGNRRRRQVGNTNNFDFTDSNIDGFFISDVIPFEGILKPLEHITDLNRPLRNTDISEALALDITSSVSNRRFNARGNDLLYRLGISNFLAAVPHFFLKKKQDGGHMTKFVAEIPSRANPASPGGTAPQSDTSPRTVSVSRNSAYVMEVGLTKTANFNLYSNPAAFGQPTSTGSVGWESLRDLGWNLATTSSLGPSSGSIPVGREWPLHRAEFAPYTPPYYYGDSVVRITYMPTENKEVTLNEILGSNEIYVDYRSPDEHYYDFSSGSYAFETGSVTVSTTTSPPYEWNRAWQNRQDLDASIVIDNQYPTEGGEISPSDPNKWVIMPKWECPALHFSGTTTTSIIDNGEFNVSTKGMWHQYGVMPDNEEGVYLYVADMDDRASEFVMVGDPYGLGSPSSGETGGGKRALKLPLFVKNSGRNIQSLASLVGFKPEEIMPAGQWIPERAKRIGELAEDNEKTISEGILAIPYYYDSENEKHVVMTMTADPQLLGPKIKEFRRAFTKYSLPPPLRKKLVGMLPDGFPEVPSAINPFLPPGHEDADLYNKVRGGTDINQVPVVYLLEHTMNLTRQDLSDIWQGVMPDVSKTVQTSVTSIDHYMPGVNSNYAATAFGEIIQKQMDLGLPQTGIPRIDLLDIVDHPRKNGFQPEIKWLVFKVKERGPTYYSSMIRRELNNGPQGESYDSRFGYMSDDLPPALRALIEENRSTYTERLYHTEELGSGRNTYNWPYDYCSIVELGKLSTKVGFRPDLDKEDLGESTRVLSGEGPQLPRVSSDVIASVAETLTNLGNISFDVVSQPVVQTPSISNLASSPYVFPQSLSVPSFVPQGLSAAPISPGAPPPSVPVGAFNSLGTSGVNY